MARCVGGRWFDAAMALAVLALGILLCLLGAGLLTQWEVSAAHHHEASTDVLLAAASAAAGLALLLWWTISILGAGAAVLLEHLGKRGAAAAARRLSPAFMQRAVVAVLSLQLVTGVAAHAAPVPPTPEWTPTQARSSSPSIPAESPDGAGYGGRGMSAGSNGQPQFIPEWKPSASWEEPDPEPAGTGAGPQQASTLDPGWQPAVQVVEPGLLAAPQTRTLPDTGVAGPGGSSGEVAVLAGDTLWDIVANYLGPEASDVDIALEWPRWYAANRAQIGGSPDVLLPGQVLQAPTAPYR